MHTRAKIFIADCAIGTAIGAILGSFLGIVTDSSIAGWLITTAAIGLVISGAIGSGMDAIQKRARALGSACDGAMLGAVTGWITGYIALLASAFIRGMTQRQFGSEGTFFILAMTALIIAALGVLVGLFINGAIARLGKQEQPESSNP